MADREIEIRCFCKHRPLLAVGGRDSITGEPYIHIRAFKSKQIHTEAVVTEGTVRIRCRECFRWQTVTIERTSLKTRLEDLPNSIEV